MSWPALPYEPWSDTLATLHMWTQIVGKIRTALVPWTCHSWHVTLYPTARGLTTSPMHHAGRTLQIDFDILQHRLIVDAAAAGVRTMKLEPRSVASFHAELMAHLHDLGASVAINTTPSEVEDPVPFDEDAIHESYDAEAVERFWQVLSQSARMLTAFRARFLGKCSPVHFFWGSFDLAVTRFSGRPAPPHPGGIPNLPDWITREAYSHEVCSAGFWPGGPQSPAPAYYAYAYPVPDGLADAAVAPAAAFYSEEMREYFLPYDAVREAEDPAAALLAFLQTTYDVIADRAGWDRSALEVPEGYPRAI